MKRIIYFSRFSLPAFILSLVLAGAGVAGYFLKGFNLGIDFQGGLIQEIQFAPAAFSLSYSGRGNAKIDMSRNNITIVISGAGTEEFQYDFPFSEYPAMGDMLRGLSAINGIEAEPLAAGTDSIRSTWLIQSAQSGSRLGLDPYVMHYLSPDTDIIHIEDVRTALASLGTVSVQVLGEAAERRFMIRIDVKEAEDGGEVSAETILRTLEAAFGRGELAVTRSDFVGSKVSKQLTNQVGLLTCLTLLLILAYSAVRFKPQYAVGAVLGIIHNGLIMVAFIVWTRMEFNTTSIAAILTILGYSINDTIVIFDRLRETRRIYPDDSYVMVLNRSITETMSRTLITTFTTMLAVASLYFFTTGAMKDFALALMVGMISGVYATIFIASGFVNFWETRKERKNKKTVSAAPAGA
ncbi:MAG: protein translocase subunit SecF [Treponema sp.]|jgi:preprotein translocase subunit SecF|nr:protein translocase subunit SecF [Treponema sp.]